MFTALCLCCILVFGVNNAAEFVHMKETVDP
jgi:hypothetical protein